MSDASELSALIERLVDGRVLCVGDVILDRYIEGRVDRVSPEGPIPVLAVEREAAMLGGAGNVVRNLCSLGAKVELVAVVGDDAIGDEIETMLHKEALAQPHLIRISGRNTSVKSRYLARGQQLLRADHESSDPISADECDAVIAVANSAIEACDAMILSDYGKGVLTDDVLGRLIAMGRDANIAVIVDPKGRDYSRYRGASILTPNRQELAEATGQSTDGDAAVVAACESLISACGVDGVLATRGEDGATLVQGGGVTHLLARRPREVFDVSGAGDTVVAALAAGLSAGASMATAAELANTAAGVVVGKVGTAVAWPSELLAALHEHEFMSGEAKIMTLRLAADHVAAWRRQGLKVGFTNGCFDLLHPGHISLLMQARSACDRLVVALNSDESVMKLKGADRPIQTATSRAAVLASLAAVDLVIVFAEDTPIALIESLQPEVLIKGADYAIDDVVGASEVQSWGGSVLLAELAEGYSTSSVIRKLTK